MNFKLGKCLLILAAIVIAIVASGCVPDYGFEDYEEYYATFKDIHLLTDDLSSSSYDMEDDFYNEELMTEGIEAAMDLDYYSYLFFKIDKEIEVREMYLHVLGEENGELVVDLIHTTGVPGLSRKYNSPKTKIDEETGEEKLIDYGDPVPIKSTFCSISSKWSSFGFKLDNSIIIHKGDYLCFRFKNNTAYGLDEGLKKYKIATSLLSVRAENYGGE